MLKKAGIENDITRMSRTIARLTSELQEERLKTLALERELRNIESKPVVSVAIAVARDCVCKHSPNYHLTAPTMGQKFGACMASLCLCRKYVSQA